MEKFNKKVICAIFAFLASIRFHIIIHFLKVLMKRIRGAGWTLAEGSEDGAIITEEDLRFGKYRKCQIKSYF